MSKYHFDNREYSLISGALSGLRSERLKDFDKEIDQAVGNTPLEVTQKQDYIRGEKDLYAARISTLKKKILDLTKL